MRRRDHIRRECKFGEIADIRIARELDPGPAFFTLENRDDLAGERLRVEAGVRRGRVLQVGDGRRDLHPHALDEARGLDLSLQMRGGEIGPRRRQALVERHD